MNADEMVTVQVDAVEPMSGSVWLGLGIGPDGRRIVFAGDPRALSDIADALEERGGRVTAEVPSWSILAGWA